MPDHRQNRDTQRVPHGPPNRDVNAGNRASLAIKLRASKMTYDQIAAQCGFADRSACRKAVMRELQRVVVADVEELRREECYTLDMLQTECMKLALDKDNKARLFAVDRCLAIMERRSRLMGLDIKPDENINNNITVVREVPFQYLGIPQEVQP
jgi:hypothetical protein